jgi:hypothetical protein
MRDARSAKLAAGRGLPVLERRSQLDGETLRRVRRLRNATLPAPTNWTIIGPLFRSAIRSADVPATRVAEEESEPIA